MKRLMLTVTLLTAFGLAAIPVGAVPTASSNDADIQRGGVARAWGDVAYTGGNVVIQYTAEPGSCTPVPVGDPAHPTRVYSAALFGYAETVLLYSGDLCTNLVATLNAAHKADSGIVTCRNMDRCKSTPLGEHGAVFYKVI